MNESYQNPDCWSASASFKRPAPRSTKYPDPCLKCGSDNVDAYESDPYIGVICLDCMHSTGLYGDLESALETWNTP